MMFSFGSSAHRDVLVTESPGFGGGRLVVRAGQRPMDASVLGRGGVPVPRHPM
jgi:hypothetical protein